MIEYAQVAAGPSAATLYPPIDFETYSEAGYVYDAQRQKWESLPGIAKTNRGLSVVGVRKYVTHPSFRLLSLAYDLLDSHGMRLQTDFCFLAPEDLLAYLAAGGIIEAWGAGFEFTVWNYHCVPRLGWPALPAEQIRCCMAKARASSYPGALANTGSVLNLREQKDAEGKRLLRKFSVPRNPTKKDPRTYILPFYHALSPINAPDDLADGQRLFQYNMQDVRSELEASSRICDLAPTALRIWQTAERVNRRGVQINMAALEDCISIVEQATAKYNHEFYGITGIASVTEVAKLTTWLHSRGVHMDDLQEETVAAQLERINAAPPEWEAWTPIRRALEIRQMLASASVKKLFALRAQADASGRVYDLYSFNAARTGRFTGNGPQPANLYKGEWKDPEAIKRAFECLAVRNLDLVEYEYGNALTVVNNVLRSLFIAAPGCRLISSDYTSIEAVVAAALSGEEWVLEVFRTHGMLYEAAAARVTGIPFQEFIDYKRINGKHHLQRNLIGKYAVLASWYGGWIPAWKQFGADEYLSDEEIKKGIIATREASPAIVEMWGGQSRGKFDWSQDTRPELYGLEGAAIRAVKEPGTAFNYREISFEVYNSCLYMRLPSGRLLHYHNPTLAPSTRPYAENWELELSFEGWNSNQQKGPIGWICMFLYGGLLFENAVQAVAYDIFGKAFVKLDATGYPIVLHNYDEFVCEVPYGEGSVAELEAIMVEPDEWWATWPIQAKGGWEGPFYGKFD